MRRANPVALFVIVLVTGASVWVPARDGRALVGGASLLGSYRLVPIVQAAESRVRSAIDAVVSDVSPVLQPATRGRLLATNRVSRDITVREARGWVTVQYDDRRYVTRIDGWRTIDIAGEQVRLLTQVRRPHLYQTFVGRDGTKLIVLTAQDRSLWLDVTASSPNLPRAVRYRLEYRRVSG